MAVVLRCIAVVLAAAAALLLAVIPAQPAAAAVTGPGWGPSENGGLGFIGAFVVGGRHVYCLEPFAKAPLGTTTGPEYGGWGSAAPDDLARASWAIETRGQSSDRRDTAAVNLYVWSLLAPADYNGHGMPGDEWYAAFIPDVADRAEVFQRLAQLRHDGAGVRAITGSGSGSITITIDPVDEYVGAVSVTGLHPAGAVGTLVLDNAVFDATGTGTIAGVGGGAVLPITGTPPAGATPYRVSVDGSFAVSGWTAEVEIWRTPGEQTLAYAGRSIDLVFPLTGADARDRSVVFQPVVRTLAESRVLPGDRFVDHLEFELVADSAGRVNRWYRTAAGYLPVTASCRVYGPFRDRPERAAAPPPGALVASSFVVTTGPDGPHATYPVDSEQALTTAGWYTAQCSIDAGSQPGPSRPFLPAGYRYEDDFGIDLETAVVPFLPSLDTRFTAATAVSGDALVDRVTVGVAEGPWPRDSAGSPVPIELVGRFTRVDERPVRAREAPPDATQIAVRHVTAHGPGTVVAEAVRAPAGTGWIVAQWCVVEALVVLPRCDDWGVASETVAFGPPPVVAIPQLAVTGDDGTALAAAAGLAVVGLGAGALLRIVPTISRLGARDRRPEEAAR